MTRPKEPQPDSTKHCSWAELEAVINRQRQYSDRLALIVHRKVDGSREIVQGSLLDVSRGVVGDRWELSSKRKPSEQIAVMSVSVAEAIANGQSWTLFGDNLFVDSDLREQSFPVGQRYFLGETILEVSHEPHTGCSKFQNRFGAEALKLISSTEYKSRRLRGIYFIVVKGGEIRLGDILQQM